MINYYYKGYKITDYSEGIISGIACGKIINDIKAKAILSELLSNNKIQKDFFVISDLCIDIIPKDLNPRYCNNNYFVEIDFTEDSEKWIRENSNHWILVSGKTKQIYNYCPELEDYYEN